MRIKIAVALVVVLVAVVAAQVLASLMFLWILGYLPLYPWPMRGWMWARYTLEAWSNPIVHRWLIITGIVSAATIAATAGVVGRAWWAWGSPSRQPNLYGKMVFADQDIMSRNGLKTSRKPIGSE